ncbi:MAG: hypothetical protein DRP84_01870 [Spirochaetes bacterium]|nr:MAG: hypothetical protein DRP84_01870 [Spirochaetota bacterium]
MLKKFAHFVVRYRIPIIVLSLLTTFIFMYFAKNIKINSNLVSLAPENNKELQALKRNLKIFGSSTYIMISVKSDNAYSLSTLTKIKKVSDAIKKLPEVEEVIDPLNATVFKYIFGMVVIKQTLPGGKIPESKEKIEEFKNEVLSEPILKNVVVSENGEALAIFIKLKNEKSGQYIRDKLLKIIKKYEGPEKFYMTGRPIIESWVKDYMKRDIVRLVIPIIVLVILVLYINFRSARGIILPISIMISSIIWTLGLMGIFGKTITLIGVMLPTLILVISSSYSIHFLNQYYKDIYIDSHKKRNVEKSIIHIGKTIILAALTTIAGFAALSINKIKPMRELGVFVLVGVLFSMTLSLTFLPSILCVIKKPKRKIQASTEGSKMSLAFDKLGRFIIRRRYIILGIAIAIGIWSVFGIKNIRVDTSWQRFFKKNSEILKTQRFIKSTFGGTSTINITFEIDEKSPLTFKTLDTLRYIDTYEEWIKSKNLFGPTLSIVDYIKRANQLMNKNNPEYYKLPDNNADLLKIFLMFKMSKFTKSLGNVITPDYKKANIVIRTAGVDKPDITVPQFKHFLKELDQFIKDHPFKGIKVERSGIDIIFVSLIDYLVKSQLLSIGISVFIVFLIISYTFKSFAYGLFGLIPIIFGLFLNFGAMSYFDINLDFLTSMIASIAVGLGVDNSIHYLIRFTKTKRTLPLDERLRIALVNSGIPIFFTSLTLVAGFSVLLFSSFKPILYFGLLITVTMLGCLIGVIFVLPAIIYLTNPKAIVKGKVQ